MALIHHVYVGHFIPYEGFIQLHEGVPVCDKPINREVFAELVAKHLGTENGTDECLSTLGLSINPNYIVGNRYGQLKVLRLISDYAKQTGARIVDFGNLMMLTGDELTSS